MLYLKLDLAQSTKQESPKMSNKEKTLDKEDLAERIFYKERT